VPHVQQGVEQLLCLSVSRSASQWTQKCKYAKEPAEHYGSTADCESTKQPRQTKHQHDTDNADQGLTVPVYFFFSEACTIFLSLCFRSTCTTRTNTTMLNSMMAKMGPRKTPNQTPMWSKKQLKW